MSVKINSYINPISEMFLKNIYFRYKILILISVGRTGLDFIIEYNNK